MLDYPCARALALAALTRREHSRAELTAKLVEKGCGAQLAAEVVAGLVAERLVSDERFVEALIAARRRRGYGPLRIRQELQDKGVADGEIDGALDARGRGWLDDARRVRAKRFGTRLPGSYPERARQARFLQYRGFSHEQIEKVLASDEAE